ncbi:hypothetical protein PanWU01x14_124180 [Parasponia andersonii]|uniref:Uncharacterized protein n=1 Tax=Parasponia andersonii TaxID=3476 RepID=A0A2P5CTH7_PARAD|nr:hypothetical protein PanWU01x14_124180 [Parasponia andersonii]
MTYNRTTTSHTSLSHTPSLASTVSRVAAAASRHRPSSPWSSQKVATFTKKINNSKTLEVAAELHLKILRYEVR